MGHAQVRVDMDTAIQHLADAAAAAGRPLLVLYGSGRSYKMATPPGQDPTVTAGMLHAADAAGRCPGCQFCAA